MGFWASGDSNPYATHDPGQISAEEYEKEKARQKSFADNFAVAAKEKGNLTPEYDKNRAAIMGLYDARKRLGGPAAVTAAQAGYVAPSGAGASYQGDAAKHLLDASGGKGPSVAGSIAGQGVDAGLRARLASLANVHPGGSIDLANVQAGGAASNAMQSAAVQSALAKAQETQAAAQQFGGLATAMRGADLGAAQMANKVALGNAGLAQGVSLANQDASLKWTAMSDAEKNALLGMAMGLDQNEMANRQNYYNFTHGLSSREKAQAMRDRMLEDQRRAEFLSGVGGAAGYAAKAWGAYQDEEGNGWGSYREDLTR